MDLKGSLKDLTRKAGTAAYLVLRVIWIRLLFLLKAKFPRSIPFIKRIGLLPKSFIG